jgi:biopolymer transport protein ExbD
MNFYTRRKSRPVLQIISMIDILIVLLIFLVVTTTFRESSNHLRLNLPRSGSSSTGGDPVPRLALTVTKDEVIYVGEAPVSAENLISALEDARTSRPDVKLELRMDEKVPLGTTVKIWDALKIAGFEMKDVPFRMAK